MHLFCMENDKKDDNLISAGQSEHELLNKLTLELIFIARTGQTISQEVFIKYLSDESIMNKIKSLIKKYFKNEMVQIWILIDSTKLMEEAQREKGNKLANNFVKFGIFLSLFLDDKYKDVIESSDGFETTLAKIIANEGQS